MPLHDTRPFQIQLLQLRAAVSAQLTALRGGVIGRAEASADHFTGHDDSTAQTASARELEFALDDHESAELNAIDAALQRIKNGTYGDCTDCGVEISAARLHAAPEAPRCVPCQEKMERH